MDKYGRIATGFGMILLGGLVTLNGGAASANQVAPCTPSFSNGSTNGTMVGTVSCEHPQRAVRVDIRMTVDGNETSGMAVRYGSRSVTTADVRVPPQDPQPGIHEFCVSVTGATMDGGGAWHPLGTAVRECAL